MDGPDPLVLQVHAQGVEPARLDHGVVVEDGDGVSAALERVGDPRVHPPGEAQVLLRGHEVDGGGWPAGPDHPIDGRSVERLAVVDDDDPVVARGGEHGREARIEARRVRAVGEQDHGDARPTPTEHVWPLGHGATVGERHGHPGWGNRRAGR